MSTITPKGFNNVTGACCWWNSLLQALLCSKHFVDTIQKEIIDSNSSHSLIYLKKIIKNETDSINGLKALLVDLQKYQPSMIKIVSEGQQSASEGLVLLLERLNLDSVNHLFTHCYLQSIRTVEGESVSSRRESNNFFAEFDEEDLLKRGLLECLLTVEQEMPDYKHKDNKLCIKTLKLKRIPTIVVVLLNRYKRKNASIKLPDNFNVNHISGRHIQYNKISCVDHFGSLHGGHYIARGNRNSETYLFNDITLQKNISLETTSNTYITFYEAETDV